MALRLKTFRELIELVTLLDHDLLVRIAECTKCDLTPLPFDDLEIHATIDLNEHSND